MIRGQKIGFLDLFAACFQGEADRRKKLVTKPANSEALYIRK
jgi:hypothetical protein